MPAITKPSNHFNAVLYSGANPSSQTVGVGFQPDFVWIKSRTQTYGHYVFDVVRTPTFGLITNTTAGDSTGDALTFTANGFTTTASAGATNDPTGAPNNFACFSWKAGGTSVSNTSGTISAQVSANPTAGFSVVTYTHNGTNAATVGHGLGVTPSFIINKQRSAVSNWRCYHASLTAGYNIQLNLTSAQGTAADIFQTAPTSSVFTPGNGDSASGQTFVSYCFAPIAGYSAFGSYTGNGSADGPFVYTGFRPRFILYKRATGGVGNWVILDTNRDTYNLSLTRLFPSNGDAENAATAQMDILSNGFKIRVSGATDSGTNDGSSTYIYAAFAENPFKYANAR